MVWFGVYTRAPCPKHLTRRRLARSRSAPRVQQIGQIINAPSRPSTGRIGQISYLYLSSRASWINICSTLASVSSLQIVGSANQQIALAYDSMTGGLSAVAAACEVMAEGQRQDSCLFLLRRLDTDSKCNLLPLHDTDCCLYRITAVSKS